MHIILRNPSRIRVSYTSPRRESHGHRPTTCARAHRRRRARGLPGWISSLPRGPAPDLSPGILTGVSAGGMIAAIWRPDRRILGVRRAPFQTLAQPADGRCLPRRPTGTHHADDALGHAAISGGAPGAPAARSLVDTAPLRAFVTQALQPDPDGTIPGIAASLAMGRLCAIR